jgi:hypothetical protein
MYEELKPKTTGEEWLTKQVQYVRFPDHRRTAFLQ